MSQFYMAGDDQSSPESRGERFLLLRMAMPGELTQTQMGRLIGVTQVSWGWYEQGVRKPSWDNLTKLEKATGAPKSWVMDGLVKDVPPDLMGRLLKAEKELELRRKREAKKNRS